MLADEEDAGEVRVLAITKLVLGLELQRCWDFALVCWTTKLDTPDEEVREEHDDVQDESAAVQKLSPGLPEKVLLNLSFTSSCPVRSASWVSSSAVAVVETALVIANLLAACELLTSIRATRS